MPNVKYSGFMNVVPSAGPMGRFCDDLSLFMKCQTV